MLMECLYHASSKGGRYPKGIVVIAKPIGSVWSAKERGTVPALPEEPEYRVATLDVTEQQLEEFIGRRWSVDDVNNPTTLVPSPVEYHREIPEVTPPDDEV